jgi:choline dehydrogenase-like flavoprotein
VTDTSPTDMVRHGNSVDVCVIGSGAGGAPVALALGRAGFSVVVLEKGPWYAPSDFVHDEILNSRRNFFSPFPWDEPHLWRSSPDAPYLRTNDAWTANCVGGGTVHMSGYFYRLKPVDFKLKSTLGTIKDATVADWPIDYRQLSPFYDLAEAELGVSGNAVAHAFAEPRSRNFPLPPLAEHPVASAIDAAAKTLHLQTIPTPRGILSTTYQGRAACTYCALCGGYGCEHGAKSSTLASLIPKAVATRKVEVRPQSMALNIVAGQDGKVDSVIYRDASGAQQRLNAKIVVVSCTAVESARLLLNSKSSRFPNGLANDNGLIGKNLFFSSFGHSSARFGVSAQRKTHPWLDTVAPFVNRSIQSHYLVDDKKLPFRKGGTLGFMWAHPNPIYTAMKVAGLGPKGIFGLKLKNALRELKDTRTLEFELYGEFLTTPSTQVTVDSTVKDVFGLPVAAITVKRHPLDLAMTTHLTEQGEAVLRALNPLSIERGTTSGVTTILQGGTCRFGDNAETSVLDVNCRSHVVPNLYVVDGSFMPTSGGVPPTLTITANAFRVGAHLVERLRKGS